jgi:hypothetical protein
VSVDVGGLGSAGRQEMVQTNAGLLSPAVACEAGEFVAVTVLKIVYESVRRLVESP